MKPTPLRLALVLVGVLVGLEIGARALDRYRGAPFDAERSRKEIESALRTFSQGAFIPGWPREPSGRREIERAATDTGAMKLHPYLGYQHPQTSAWIEADLAYYRTPEAEKALDVCVLGGSVAFMLATVGEKALVERLARDPALAGREVRVHNYALGGFKEPQQLMLLLWLLELGHAPDVVLNLDGANEAALGRSNFDGGTHPAYPFLPRWTNVTLGMRSDEALVERLHEVRAAQEAARSFAARFLGSGLWRSAFLERAGSLRLEKLRANYSALHADLVDTLHERPRDPEIAGPRLAGGESDLVRAVATCWEESSVGLQAVCAEHGIVYLHVLQPTLFDAGSKPLTKTEIEGARAEPGWADGVPQIYPALREAGRRLESRGVDFLDATQVFRDHEEDLYFDMCHFGERGNEILAAAIAPRLLAALARR
jgi:hypothetical protein